MAPVKVAIAGMGGRAIGFSMYLAKHPEVAEVVAMVDPNTAKSAIINEAFNLRARTYESIEAALAQEEIEAVMVATPDNAHRDVSIEALQADKHLYLEKPLATTLADCDAIIAAAEKSSASCYLGFNLRHTPVHEKVHRLIQDGAVGKVTTIEANEWYYGGKTYFRRWNRLREFGGGLWLTKASHDFDILNWMAGSDAVSVYATSNLSHYKPKDGAGPRCRDCKFKDTCPDCYDFRKPKGGEFEHMWGKLHTVMEQEGRWAQDICLFNSDKDTFDNGIAVVNYANDVRATYTVNVLAAKTTRQLRVVGDAGLIEADMEAGSVQLVERHTEKETMFDLSKEIEGGHGGADDRIFKHFFDICREGGQPRSDLTDGRKAVALALAARDADDTDALVTCQ